MKMLPWLGKMRQLCFSCGAQNKSDRENLFGGPEENGPDICPIHKQGHDLH